MSRQEVGLQERAKVKVQDLPKSQMHDGTYRAILNVIHDVKHGLVSLCSALVFIDVAVREETFLSADPKHLAFKMKMLDSRSHFFKLWHCFLQLGMVRTVCICALQDICRAKDNVGYAQGSGREPTTANLWAVTLHWVTFGRAGSEDQSATDAHILVCFGIPSEEENIAMVYKDEGLPSYREIKWSASCGNSIADQLTLRKAWNLGRVLSHLAIVSLLCSK